MKNILRTLLFSSLMTTQAFAAVDYVEINLTRLSRLTSMEFSLFGACGNLICKGAEIIVPTGSRVAVEQFGNSSCAIQKSSSLQFKGGDSYIITVALKPNSNQACNVIISTRNQGKITVQLVNLQAGLPRLTGSN